MTALGESHNPKVQAAGLSALCVLLTVPDLSSRAKVSLQEERPLVSSLAALVDSTQPVLQAKALVTLGLLSRHNAKFLAAACSTKILERLERLGNAQLPPGADPYLPQIVAALRAELGQQLGTYVQGVGEECSRQGQSRGGRVGSAGAGGAATPGGSGAPKLAAHFSLVSALLGSPACRSQAVTPSLIQVGTALRAVSVDRRS